jgi:ElaA protein
MRWRWCRFEDLGVHALYDVLALRARVFILEQGPFLDPDGCDASSWHLLGHDDQGSLQAYLRVVDPGVKFKEPSIGRVVTSLEIRGLGQGKALVAEGISRCENTWPGLGIRISAQARLRRFYSAFGFEDAGAEHIEDDLPHQVMVKAPIMLKGGLLDGLNQKRKSS